MQYKIFQLRFKSPLHLSDIRSDYGKSERMLHSDTLTAAIMQTWAMLGKSEWISKDYGFTVSSLFPFTTDIQNQIVYFLPKPYIGLNIPKESTDPSLAKIAKKVNFLAIDYFQKALNQELVEVPTEHYQGVYLSAQEIDKNFLLSDVRVRIRQPRKDAEDAEPFYMEQLIFKENSGLWGMVCFENEAAEKRFSIALDILQDAGLGTDRNIGQGQFCFDWDNTTELGFNTNIEKYGICLSLFCPADHQQLCEMLPDEAQYETIKRGGWISEPHNTFRKKSVMMFREGSVFKMAKPASNIVGNVVNLQPDILKEHPIWRSGKAIFLPINWQK